MRIFGNPLKTRIASKEVEIPAAWYLTVNPAKALNILKALMAKKKLQRLKAYILVRVPNARCLRMRMRPEGLSLQPRLMRSLLSQKLQL